MVFKITAMCMFEIIKIIKYFNAYLSASHRTSKKKKNEEDKEKGYIRFE